MKLAIYVELFGGIPGILPFQTYCTKSEMLAIAHVKSMTLGVVKCEVGFIMLKTRWHSPWLMGIPGLGESLETMHCKV